MMRTFWGSPDVRNFHSLTHFCDSSTKNGWGFPGFPLPEAAVGFVTSDESFTVPSFASVNSSRTCPEIMAWRANGGYEGAKKWRTCALCADSDGVHPAV